MGFIKNIFVSILIFNISFGYAQLLKNDSIHVSYDVQGKLQQVVYIEKKYPDRYSNELCNFKRNSISDGELKSTNDKRISGSQFNPIKNPVLPWSNWVKLVKYRGGYYLYYPCDFSYHVKHTINDSSFIDWTNEGLLVSKIVSNKKVDSITYGFEIFGLMGKRELIVSILDSVKGIAVFEIFNQNKLERKYLMIAQQKCNLVPVIVNLCYGRKYNEFEFPEIE